jgi:nitronate monooxygenase
MSRRSEIVSRLAVPVVQAPMAGGPSNPRLAAAVNRGGGLGFLAAGYLNAERLADDITEMRELSDGPFGVNVFVGGGTPADREIVRAYAARLDDYAAVAGVELGVPRFDDDSFDEKIVLLAKSPVAVVSFTFGVPPAETIMRLQETGSEVWLTVTSPAEAVTAAACGADALIVQGVEAGGHRGVFVDDELQSDLTLLAALQLIGNTVDLPLVASGAIMTGAALASVLVAGACAGQIGSAFLRSSEAGTTPAHRQAVEGELPTVLTRAFTGRLARGIRNRWHEEHGACAPSAYPEVHHVTSPLRAHGRRIGDADLINLWAGQAHQLARELSAEQITAEFGRDAREAIAQAAARLAPMRAH